MFDLYFSKVWVQELLTKFNYLINIKLLLKINVFIEVFFKNNKFKRVILIIHLFQKYLDK